MSTQTVDPPSSVLTPTRKPGETQRLQTVCIEIPIIVQGSRNSHPPQPFLEETRTVIVFPHGAVLRLTEVVTQGQIVIIQNMRLKQEVACRVTSSKPSASVKGYVEVEFTQPTPGFWGIGFPGETITPRNEVTAPAPAASVPPANVPATSVPHPSVNPTMARPSNGQPANAAPVSAAPTSPTSTVFSTPKESQVAPPAPQPVAPVRPEAPAAQVRKPTPEDTLALNRAIVAAFASQPAKPAAEALKKSEVVEKVEAREEQPAPVVTGAEPVQEVAAAPVAQVPATPAARTPMAQALAPATPVQAAPAAPVVPAAASAPAAPIAATPVSVAAAALVLQRPATPRDSGKLSEPIRENVRENLSNKARDEARQDLLAIARGLETKKPASASSPISLAESLEANNAATPAIKTPTPAGTESKPFAKKAKKEKQSADKTAAQFAEHAAVQVADSELFGQRSASTLSAAPSSNKTKILAIAAVVVAVLAGGAFGYRWYARSRAANSPSATLTNTAPGANTPAATNSTTAPGVVHVNALPLPTTAAPSTGKNTSTAQNQAAPAGITSGGPTGSKGANNPVNTAQRRQTTLPMNISAPKAPSAGAQNNGATTSIPELNLQTPPPTVGNGQMISLGSIGSMPAPPAPRGSSTAPVNSGASYFVGPKLLSMANPVYPKMALVRGDQGDVVVTAMVNEQGKVYGAKATSGPPTLREAAVDAVSQFRYEPGKLNGRTVASAINVTIRFKGKQ
jgi:TonB family protein